MATANDDPAKEKLARTMRIDLTPEALATGPSGQHRSPVATRRRIVTKKGKRIQTSGQGPATPEKKHHFGSPNSDFQQLLQSVYDAAIISDMRGKIVAVNDRAASFFRYSKEDLVSISVLDLISGSDDDLITTICENLVERFVLIEACYCVRNDGSLFPAEIAVNQLQLSDSDYLCFFVRDITLRRQAEERLRVEHNAIQNSHSGIVITGLDARIQYANPAVCRMWGYNSPDELANKDIRDLLPTDQLDHDLLNAITADNEVWMREVDAKRRDGSQFALQMTAAANSNSDGQLVGIVFSFVDISDRKRADQAVREAERHRVMLESLGAACHHLGQPATVLLANLGIMRSKTGTPSGMDISPLIDSCLEAAEALSDTLHKLNATNEYRTIAYLEETGESGETRILDI